jgi:hypothetical protein
MPQFDRTLRSIRKVTFLLKILVATVGYPLSTRQISGPQVERFSQKKFPNFVEKFAVAMLDPAYTGSGCRWRPVARPFDAYPCPLPPCVVGGRYPPPLIFGEFSNLVSAKFFGKLTDTPCLGAHVSG